LKEPLAAERPQVIERDRRRRQASRHLSSVEVHEVELRVKSRKSLWRVGWFCGGLHGLTRESTIERKGVGDVKRGKKRTLCLRLAPECPIVLDPMLAHVRSAWRSWLAALATDAEAAIAAALTYESLPGEVRDAWLDAIGSEAPTLGVPVVAFYGPLLGVELDPSRIGKMRAAVAADPASARAVEPEPLAWLGVGKGGVHACVVASALYLDYVRVLICRYTPKGGFLSAAYDPLRNVAHLSSLHSVEGIAVEPTPLPVVVDELAHAVLADRRQDRASPPELQPFVELFVPEPKWMAVGPPLASGAQVG